MTLARITIFSVISANFLSGCVSHPCAAMARTFQPETNRYHLYHPDVGIVVDQEAKELSEEKNREARDKRLNIWLAEKLPQYECRKAEQDIVFFEGPGFMARIVCSHSLPTEQNNSSYSGGYEPSHDYCVPP